MSKVKINIPPQFSEAIEKAAEKEGITADELAERAMKKLLVAVRDLITTKQHVTSFGIQMEKARVIADLFIMNSNYCSEESNFSIRNFMHQGRGRRLFIVFDNESRKSSENMVRLFLDIALKEACSGEDLLDDDKRRFYFIMDEYGYFPSGLEYLELSKDQGRSKGIRIFAAFQTYSHLIKLYGGKEENAMNDAAGYGDIIVITPHDGGTRDFIVNRCGTETKEITTIDVMCNVHTETKEMPVVPPAVLNSLKRGEAVILPDEGRPFWFRFDK